MQLKKMFMAIVKNSISVKLGKYELFGSAVQITETRRTPAIKRCSRYQEKRTFTNFDIKHI